MQRHAAALCYICCADVDAAVTLWLSEATDASLPVPRLQSVLEKSISLCLAAAHQAATASLADLLANYALRLVDQGAMRSAITYLSLLDQLPTESVPSLAVLKDRVSQCSPTQVHASWKCLIYPTYATQLASSSGPRNFHVHSFTLRHNHQTFAYPSCIVCKR